jgi:hypothetical protein
MRAADARRIVAELGLEDRVAKEAVDAPPLTDEQRVALRSILLTPDAEEAALTPGATSSFAVHDRLPGHEANPV